MRILSLLLIMLPSLVSAKSLPEIIKIKAEDGFELVTDYFDGGNSDKGVLMLHQCNEDRSMYRQLGELLSKAGIHAMSLDFRMYGDSANETVNVEPIFAIEDEDSRRKAFREHSQHWPTDVEKVYEVFSQKVGELKAFAIVGASCGGGQAIRLAHKQPAAALGFLSSGMNDAALERYQQVADTPTYIVAAEQDTFTFDSAQKLFAIAQDEQSRLVSYKGQGHGLPLFSQDPQLLPSFVAWLKGRLELL